MIILVLNAGSSTLKFSLIESEGEKTLASGGADWSEQPARLLVQRPGLPEESTVLALKHHGDAVRPILDALTGARHPVLSSVASIAAVGHRVVHGGDAYTSSVLITAEVKKTVADLAELAPLHNPAALKGINAAETALPRVPQVAVFDTAFHATIPPAARLYPLPHAWSHDWNLHRYGFHGLSHAYCAGRAADLLGRPCSSLRLVICHLGNGCSISAIRNGRSVDTSMGFTPLEGLMMGTRSGSVDPGLVLYVLRRKGLTVDQLEHALNQESGLLGVTGISNDMRKIQAAVAAGQERARLAVEMYVHRIRKTIGAMIATLGGCEAIVFTAGVGEHSAEVREQSCRGLECMGLKLDREANVRCRPDADVATADSPGRILVIATREDVTIVRETLRVLDGDKREPRVLPEGG